MAITTVEELIHALAKEDPKAQICLCYPDEPPTREISSVEADHQLNLVVIWGRSP